MFFLQPFHLKDQQQQQNQPMGEGGTSEMIFTSPHPDLLHHSDGEAQWPSIFMGASPQTNLNESEAASWVSSNFPGVEKRIYVRVNKMATLHSNPGQDCRQLMAKTLIIQFKPMNYLLQLFRDAPSRGNLDNEECRTTNGDENNQFFVPSYYNVQYLGCS